MKIFRTISALLLGAYLAGAATPVAQQWTEYRAALSGTEAEVAEIIVNPVAIAGADVGIDSIPILASTDGQLYSRYLNGDAPPTAADLRWDIADAFVQAGMDSLTGGTPFSINVCPYLLGADRESATISFVTVSGDDMADEGWTVGSSCAGANVANLAWDGGLEGGAGASTFRMVATIGGANTQSAVKSWSGTAPSSVPAKVTGVAAQVDSSSAITITWDAASGATSYKARRGGAEIATGVACCSYQHTGLSASTSYTFDVIGTNGAGDGPDSDDVSATTNPSGSATLDPDYPRLFLRQMFSNGTCNPQTSLTCFNTFLPWVARYDASMGNSGRNTTLGGGTIDPSELVGAIKAKRAELFAAGEVNLDHPTAYTKYTNVTQLNSNGGDEFQLDKAAAETNGDQGDWHVHNTCSPSPCEGTKVLDAGNNKWKMNYTTYVDNDHNGLQWNEWFPRYHFAATSDTKAGFSCSSSQLAAHTCNFGTGNDYVPFNGRGLKEGDFDGVFEDDTAMLSGDAATFLNNKDLDGNGDADPNSNQGVRDAMSGGFNALAAEWRSLFATQSPRTLQYVIGNITAVAQWDDYWPPDMRNTWNGGLIEEFSGKTKTRGFGDLVTNDSALQPYSGVLGMYVRGMDFSISPKIVAMGHEPEPEWRDKWGCKPGALEARCNSTTKANNWISEGGVCTNGATSPGTFCKYPGRWQDFSDWRLMRWALAFVMMDDGYFSTNQQTDTWRTGLPWYDEYVGGTQVNQKGWCGQPIDPPQRAAYQQGVWKREYENCIIYHNPPRGTPNVEQTKTVDLPAAGSGKRWKHLCAKTGGYTTDSSSGTQDVTVNDGSWVGAANTATTVPVKQIDGVFLWRAPSTTALACP
jgi:hypothetical protein